MSELEEYINNLEEYIDKLERNIFIDILKINKFLQDIFEEKQFDKLFGKFVGFYKYDKIYFKYNDNKKFIGYTDEEFYKIDKEDDIDDFLKIEIVDISNNTSVLNFINCDNHKLKISYKYFMDYSTEYYYITVNLETFYLKMLFIFKNYLYHRKLWFRNKEKKIKSANF